MENELFKNRDNRSTVILDLQENSSKQNRYIRLCAEEQKKKEAKCRELSGYQGFLERLEPLWITSWSVVPVQVQMKSAHCRAPSKHIHVYNHDDPLQCVWCMANSLWFHGLKRDLSVQFTLVKPWSYTLVDSVVEFCPFISSA